MKLSREQIFRLLNPHFEHSISCRLKRVRVVHGLTQAEFAKKLGISKRTYIHYETAERSVNVELAAKISWDFKVDSSWLLLGVGEMYRDYESEDQFTYDQQMQKLSEVNLDDPAEWPDHQDFDTRKIEEMEVWEDLKERVGRLSDRQRTVFKRTGLLPSESSVMPKFSSAQPPKN